LFYSNAINVHKRYPGEGWVRMG